MSKRASRKLRQVMETPFAAISGIASVIAILTASLIPAFGLSQAAWVFAALTFLLLSVATGSWLVRVPKDARPSPFVKVTSWTDRARTQDLPYTAWDPLATPGPDDILLLEPSRQLPDAVQRARRCHFLEIRGLSGAGKTTLMLQTGREFSLEGYTVYWTTSSRLSDVTDLRDLVRSADRCGGRKRVLLIDDIHELDTPAITTLRDEIADGATIVLSTVTESEGKAPEGSRPEGCSIRPRLEDVLPAVRSRYSNEAGWEELERRLSTGFVSDVWHCVFIALRGQSLISRWISALDPLEAVTLFVASARFILTGKSEIPLIRLIDDVSNSANPWMEDALRETRIAQVFRQLAQSRHEAPALLRLDGDYVRQLHLQASLRIVSTLATREPLRKDVLTALRRLLSKEPVDVKYAALLFYSLNSVDAFRMELRDFAEQQSEWFAWYLNTVGMEHFHLGSTLLAKLRQIKPDVASSVLESLDTKVLAQSISEVDELSQLQGAAHLLARLGVSETEEVLDAIVPESLGRRLSSMELRHVPAVAALLRKLGPKGRDVLRHSDHKILGTLVSQADASMGQEAAALVRLFRESDLSIENAIDLYDVARNSSAARPEHFPAVLALARSLPKGARQAVATQLDCRDLAASVHAHGSSPAELGALFRLLGPRYVEIVGVLDVNAIVTSCNQAPAAEIGNVRHIIEKLRMLEIDVVPLLDWPSIARAASQIEHPSELRALAKLCELIGEERAWLVEHLSEDRLRNHPALKREVECLLRIFG